VDKVYDGTTAATVTLSDNRVAGDVFTDSYVSATFVNKNAGWNKTINVSGISIFGPDAGNYTYNTTAVTRANILPWWWIFLSSGTSNLGTSNLMLDANNKNIILLPLIPSSGQ
jgi:hypothetical protein